MRNGIKWPNPLLFASLYDPKPPMAASPLWTMRPPGTSFHVQSPRSLVSSPFLISASDLRRGNFKGVRACTANLGALAINGPKIPASAIPAGLKFDDAGNPWEPHESALPDDRICVRKRNVFRPHRPIVHRGERDEDRALGFVAAGIAHFRQRQ